MKKITFLAVLLFAGALAVQAKSAKIIEESAPEAHEVEPSVVDPEGKVQNPYVRSDLKQVQQPAAVAVPVQAKPAAPQAAKQDETPAINVFKGNPYGNAPAKPKPAAVSVPVKPVAAPAPVVSRPAAKPAVSQPVARAAVPAAVPATQAVVHKAVPHKVAAPAAAAKPSAWHVAKPAAVKPAAPHQARPAVVAGHAAVQKPAPAAKPVAVPTAKTVASAKPAVAPAASAQASATLPAVMITPAYRKK